MTYILRDGKVYKQYEEEVDVAQEKYKLQAWKDALQNDTREKQEYLDKVSEIESVKISKTAKESLLQNVIIHSGSGITQEMVDAQQAKVDEINAL